MEKEKRLDPTRKADLLRADQEGWPALFVLVDENRTDDARKMIYECPSLLSTKDVRGLNVLHIAVWRGNEALVRDLIVEFGMNLSETTKWQETPLHHAVYMRQEGIVKLLLELGADPDLPDKLKRTPRKMAQRMHQQLQEQREFQQKLAQQMQEQDDEAERSDKGGEERSEHSEGSSSDQSKQNSANALFGGASFPESNMLNISNVKHVVALESATDNSLSADSQREDEDLNKRIYDLFPPPKGGAGSGEE